MTHPLLQRLAERPLLADGAMGTMLLPSFGCFEVVAEVLEALR